MVTVLAPGKHGAKGRWGTWREGREMAWGKKVSGRVWCPVPVAFKYVTEAVPKRRFHIPFLLSSPPREVAEGRRV